MHIQILQHNKQLNICETLGSHGGENDDIVVLGFGAV
jgi:hypothetical protein